MKSSTFLIFIVSGIVFFSCSSSDPHNPSSSQEDIISEYKDLLGNDQFHFRDSIIPIQIQRQIWESLIDTTRELGHAIDIIHESNLINEEKDIFTIFLEVDLLEKMIHYERDGSFEQSEESIRAWWKIENNRDIVFNNKVTYDCMLGTPMKVRYIFLEGGLLKQYTWLGSAMMERNSWYQKMDTIFIRKEGKKEGRKYGYTETSLRPLSEKSHLLSFIHPPNVLEKDTIINNNNYLVLAQKKKELIIVDRSQKNRYPDYDTLFEYQNDLILSKGYARNEVKVYYKFKPKFKFSDFNVPKYDGALAPPDFKSNPRSRRFETVIKESCDDGINFGGHYTIVKWGCGPSCQDGVIVDRKTGKIRNISATAYGSDFRRNSRLLIENIGALDTNKNLIELCHYCDVHEVEWNGKSFVKPKK